MKKHSGCLVLRSLCTQILCRDSRSQAKTPAKKVICYLSVNYFSTNVVTDDAGLNLCSVNHIPNVRPASSETQSSKTQRSQETLIILPLLSAVLFGFDHIVTLTYSLFLYSLTEPVNSEVVQKDVGHSSKQ